VKDSATREEKAFPLTDIYEDFAAIYDEMTMPKLD
jgi:histidyl-tRNA synthetase